MFKVRSLLYVFFSILGVCTINAQDYKPLFYKVSGNGLKEPSHIFGTYHLLGSSYLDHFPQVMTAFKKSKGVITEVRLSEADPYKLVTLLMMKDNSISAMLDTAAYGMVSDDLKHYYGIRLQEFDQMKPLLVTTMLVAAYAREWDSVINTHAGKELDAWFEILADSLKKTFTPLESLDDQMNMLFMQTEEQDQANELRNIVSNKAKSAAQFRTMTTAFYEADLEKIWAAVNLMDDDSTFLMDKERLLSERNGRWLVALPDLLKQSSQFIAVGAAHLAGPTGIVEGLKAKGYKVEPVQ